MSSSKGSRPVRCLSSKAAFHLGRIVFASLFILGGLDKLADPAPSLAMMAEAGLPASGALIWLVVAVELGLGLAVASGGWIIGRRSAALAALGLIVHTTAVNMLFHDFWTMDGTRARLELSLFYKNVAIMGGLAMVAGFYGPERRTA